MAEQPLPGAQHGICPANTVYTAVSLDHGIHGSHSCLPFAPSTPRVLQALTVLDVCKRPSIRDDLLLYLAAHSPKNLHTLDISLTVSCVVTFKTPAAHCSKLSLCVCKDMKEIHIELTFTHCSGTIVTDRIPASVRQTLLSSPSLPPVDRCCDNFCVSLLAVRARLHLSRHTAGHSPGPAAAPAALLAAARAEVRLQVW